MSDEPEAKRKISINWGFGDLGMWLLLAILVVTFDTSAKALKERPYSLSAAVLCRVGGPSFCPVPMTSVKP